MKRTESAIRGVCAAGCASIWYARLKAYPFNKGWAPSITLEKLPVRNKTPDRI